MIYLLCLDKQYSINIGEGKTEVLNNLETMLDNMVNLLQSYRVDDEEILSELKNDTSIKIEED